MTTAVAASTADALAETMVLAERTNTTAVVIQQLTPLLGVLSQQVGQLLTKDRIYTLTA
jgi:hypothetical protein